MSLSDVWSMLTSSLAKMISRSSGRMQSREPVVTKKGTNVSAEEFEVAIDRAICSVAYSVAYVNGFRDEDAMTRERALDSAFTYFEIALQNSSDEHVRHWLELARIELLRAKAVVAQTKTSEYERFLRNAGEFLEYAATGRVIVVDFIGSPDGSIQKPTDVQDSNE